MSREASAGTAPQEHRKRKQRRNGAQDGRTNQEERTLLKKFGLIAVASIAALVLGATVIGGSQPAGAEPTAIVQVNCLLIVGAVDGVANDTAVTQDYIEACTTQLPPGDPTNSAVQPYTILSLARLLGDQDGKLEASDFAEFENWDAQQLSSSCTSGFIPAVAGGTSVGCTSLIFAFVDDEKPVTLDNDSGLTSLQSPTTTDFICDTPGESLAGPITPGFDNDCDDSNATDGDGVVVFHVLAAASGISRGDTKTTRVIQESVDQRVTHNIVGTVDDIEIVLAEDVIGSNGSVSKANACATSTDVRDAIDPPNATLAIVTQVDQDNRPVTMWPLTIEVRPPADSPSIALLGEGDDIEDITGDTLVTLDPGDGLPIAYYRVICGGSGTGETTIRVTSKTDGSRDEASLTVVGLPANVVLTAAPAEIACDGSATSTVTATVTDSAGNNVADGTAVNFTVVALGTANPINTTTTDGKASSVITPLSNSSAGVTVIVTSGDEQVSTRVDCALPLATQPTVAPPGSPTGSISPPDTGNGGYLAQDGGMSLWTLIALAVGGTIVAAGGLVVRRSSN
jgi:hypothetical protein